METVNKHVRRDGDVPLMRLPVSGRRVTHGRDARAAQILQHMPGMGICGCGAFFTDDAGWARHLADVLFAIGR